MPSAFAGVMLEAFLAWPHWGAALTLLLLAGTLGVNAGVWYLAVIQHKAARPRLRILRQELGDGDVTFDIINEGGRDGAIREAYTSRKGMTGEEERYFLELLEAEPREDGKRYPPRDYLIRSGDRRRFLALAPKKVHRLVGDEWLGTPRRPHIEPWWGDEPAAVLHVVPVTGKGDAQRMPVHLVDGRPAKEDPGPTAR